MPFSWTCFKCGHWNSVQLGESREHAVLKCGECGHTIGVEEADPPPPKSESNKREK